MKKNGKNKKMKKAISMSGDFGCNSSALFIVVVTGDLLIAFLVFMFVL